MKVSYKYQTKFISILDHEPSLIEKDHKNQDFKETMRKKLPPIDVENTNGKYPRRLSSNFAYFRCK